MDDSSNQIVLQKILLEREKENFNATICLARKNFNEEDIKSFLHTEELKQYTERQNPRRKQTLSLGKFVAKYAVQKQLENNPLLTNFYIKKGVFEHPIVVTTFPQNTQVSVSHSGNVGAAISFPEEHPMGIDVEVLERIKPDVIATQLTKKEKQLFEEKLGSEKLAAAYLWTAKEALSKSIKTGLLIDFKYMELTEIELQGRISISKFKSFGQYKVYSFHTENIACSIVCPYKTKLDLQPILDALQF